MMCGRDQKLPPPKIIDNYIGSQGSEGRGLEKISTVVADDFFSDKAASLKAKKRPTFNSELSTYDGSVPDNNFLSLLQ